MLEIRVPVFLDGQSRNGAPHMYVSADQAKEWVYVDRIAVLTNARGQSITMKPRKLPKLRDKSCSMGPAVIEANAAGKPYAVRITQYLASHRMVCA